MHQLYLLRHKKKEYPNSGCVNQKSPDCDPEKPKLAQEVGPPSPWVTIMVETKFESKPINPFNKSCSYVILSNEEECETPVCFV